METILPSPEFQAELDDLLRNYAGRATPLASVVAPASPMPASTGVPAGNEYRAAASSATGR